LQFIGLVNGQTVTQNMLEISILAYATSGFQSWRLEWSSASDPGNMKVLTNINTPVSIPTKVYTWDLTGIPNGQVMLRLYMKGQRNTYADKGITLNLNVPTPTPTPTSTPTETLTPTPSVTPSPSEAPTETPIPSETPTPSTIPTDTP
jgi:hypothetical protein